MKRSTHGSSHRLAGCTILVAAVIGLVASSPLTLAAVPPGYYDRAAGLSGGPLKVALHEIIRGHAVIPYSQLHAPLARLHEDPANPNNVILLYSADSVAKGTDFTSATWNREHAWPRSRGNADETGPDDSDLHYIWPCYDAVNSTRINLPFDISTPADPAFRTPGHPLAPRTSLDSDSWEPPPGQRGALARCLFYVAVRYDGDEPGTSDMELVSHPPAGSQMGNLNTLLRWHEEEPVSDAERRRNDVIHADYQRNRNPFIDHPEWVALIWGAPVGATVGTSPLAGVTATIANASEQPRYSAEFKISLGQAAPPGGVLIRFRLSGTAASALDYTLAGQGVAIGEDISGGTLHIAPGATSGTITLSPVADAIAEPSETVTLTLEPGGSYTVVPNATQSATVTINDVPVLPATWRFDSGAPYPNPLPAETGNALLSFQPWAGSIASFSGVTGDSLALVGSDGNGSSVLISLSMVGQRDLAVTFQTRGTATGFTSGTWAWSTDGAAFTALPGVNTATTSSTFGAQSVSFSSLTSLENASNVTLRYTLSGATSSAANTRIDDLVVSAAPIAPTPVSAPVIASQSSAIETISGESTTLFVSASGQPAPVYRWFRDSVAIAGATNATYSIPVVSAFDAGTYRVEVTNPSGQAQATPIPLTVRPSPSRLLNVATRARAGNGEAALIAGFVIAGPGSQRVLIRGVGPALADFGVSGPLADPALELFHGSASVAQNDDWNAADAATHAAAGAFPFPPGSKDAALVQELAPGAYTVHLGSAPTGATTNGLGLIEVFELPPASSGANAPRLINLSTRALVGAGQEILIPGIAIGPPAAAGTAPPRAILLRAIGPGLATFGVTGFLARPQVKVLSSDGTLVGMNTGWQSAAHRDVLVAATARVGAFPLNFSAADSALLVSLPPAPYTVQVSGADGGSGIALVEIYEVP